MLLLKRRPSGRKAAFFVRFVFTISYAVMLLAILLPGLSMMVNGHFLKGLLCFFLQITVIGWIPAAIWGVASRSQDLAEARHRETLEVLRHAER